MKKFCKCGVLSIIIIFTSECLHIYFRVLYRTITLVNDKHNVPAGNGVSIFFILQKSIETG